MVAGASRKHQVDHGNLDHCFAPFGLALIILGKAARAVEPSKRSFHHPFAFQTFNMRLPRKDEVGATYSLLAGSVHDLCRNWKVLTQKTSIATGIMSKYLKQRCLLEAGVKAQTGLHFRALYVSWILREGRYYLQKAGQDFGSPLS